MIPLSVPEISGNEWKYVKECLDTGWVSSVGKFVDRFEQEICRFTGAEHAVACVNGTAALHIALILAGVQAEDEVLVPTLTFIAPINTVRYVGAVPVFFDCDDYYNFDVEKLATFLKKETYRKKGQLFNKTTHRRIRAILPVHIFGNALRLEELMTLAAEYDLKVIEDATESLGTVYSSGKYAGKATGTIGDFGTLSFNGNKIITTGGGGMILTNDEELARKAKYLTTQAKDDALHYIHHEIGFNYRLNNVQAAIGVAQLEQLPEFLKVKKKNYDLYQELLKEIPGLQLAPLPDYAENNRWLYALQIDEQQYGLNRDQLMEKFLVNGVQVRPIWYLNHWQKPYRNFQTYHIEKAPALFTKTLNLPSSVNLKQTEIEEIIAILKK